MFDIKNKIILVTGASSGIGREIAIQCSNMGAKVIITGRNSERLKETLAYLNSDCKAIEADLLETYDILNLVDLIPTLDGVVLNAGVVEYNPVKFLNLDKINNVMNVNFNSQVILVKCLIKFKKLNSSSSVVFMSSIASKIGVVGTAMYAASKAALNAFMKVTASELAPQKIRVNSICPGIVVTPMGENAKSMSSEVEKSYPLGLGTPQDVAGAVIFYLSDASRWVTGSELIIDGGLTLV
jgi:NAD(P)-dependent dehydrogenase (short-subunit alcohol dehydrogenase family)